MEHQEQAGIRLFPTYRACVAHLDVVTVDVALVDAEELVCVIVLVKALQHASAVLPLSALTS